MSRAWLTAVPILLTLGTGEAVAQQASQQRRSTASGGACARTPEEAERQLRRLEDDWNRAGTHRETAFFDRVLADEFVATGGPTVRTKAQYIAGIRDTAGRPATAGPPVLSTLSETRVRVYGDVAVVSGLATRDLNPPPPRRRYTEVFVCRGGRWQAVHGHYNAIAEGPNAADTARQGAGPGDDRALLALEDQWAAAVVKRDSATFERLLAPGFVYSEDDRTMSREQVLREIVSGTDTVQSAHNEDMKVHHFGPTAVVTGWLVLRGRGASGAFDRRFRYTDTWARRDGRWQIVAAHDYLVPARRP